MLNQQIVGATSLNAFTNGLGNLRKTKMGLFMDWSAKPYASLVGLFFWWGHARWVTTVSLQYIHITLCPWSHNQLTSWTPPGDFSPPKSLISGCPNLYVLATPLS